MAFLIQGAKWAIFEILPTTSIKIWLFAVFPILLLNVLSIQKKEQPTWIHALLFLSTGAIFAFALTGVLNHGSQVLIMEYIWLVLAVAAIIVHYSKSKTDIYTSS